MKEVRSWSHTSWVTNDKTFLKKISIHPKALTRKRKRTKKEKAIAKSFALYANAKKQTTQANAKRFILYAEAINIFDHQLV